MNKRKFFLSLFAVYFVIVGCYSTTVYNGYKGGVPSPVNDRMHFSLIGVIDISGEYYLDSVCPSGWVEIHSEESFLDGVVNYLLAFIAGGVLHVKDVTVKCKGETKNGFVIRYRN